MEKEPARISTHLDFFLDSIGLNLEDLERRLRQRNTKSKILKLACWKPKNDWVM
jgi:hypothetical protein